MKKALLLLVGVTLLLCTSCEKTTESKDKHVKLTGVGSFVFSDSLLVSLDLGSDLHPTEVIFFLDGATACFDDEAPYEWTWNSGESTLGLHTIQARVFLGDGDTKDSEQLEVRHMPFPFYSYYMNDWGGVTERDENGNLVGEVDPADWLLHEFVDASKSRETWLGDMTVTSFDRDVWLYWSTLYESNNTGFRIWRGMSAESMDSGTAVMVSGDTLIAGQGNCTTETQYSYRDTYRVEYTTYYYWVEAIDDISQSTFFGPVAHTVTEWDPNMENSLYSAYPNPAINTTTLGFTLSEQSTVWAMVVDEDANIVEILLDGVDYQYGEHSLVWDCSAYTQKPLRVIYYIESVNSTQWGYGDVYVQ